MLETGIASAREVIWGQELAELRDTQRSAATATGTSTERVHLGRSTAAEHIMKAITYGSYGSALVLELQDVEMPAAENDEVLIRVRGASLNPYDWQYRFEAGRLWEILNDPEKAEAA